jgi:hypothetical protein
MVRYVTKTGNDLCEVDMFDVGDGSVQIKFNDITVATFSKNGVMYLEEVHPNNRVKLAQRGVLFKNRCIECVPLAEGD